jgi:hypothetical protein
MSIIRSSDTPADHTLLRPIGASKDPTEVTPLLVAIESGQQLVFGR